MNCKQFDDLSDPVRSTALTGDSLRRARYDAGFDVPRTAHPECEVFSFSVFDLPVSTLLVWGSWKLIVSAKRQYERTETSPCAFF